MLALATSAVAQSVEVEQLTSHDDASCFVFRPSANADVSLIAFESTCDLTGDNADGNREIFQVSTDGVVLQLTDTSACANLNPSSNGQGNIVAFDSDCDFDGSNVDANVEIFVSTSAGVSQLTDAQFCSSFAPSIDASGDRIAFDSDCDFIAGTNADRSNEIFRVTRAGAITQLTDDRTRSGCGSFSASSNAAGSRIAFESDCDLAGTNEDQISEIFQVTPAGAVTQMTTSLDDTCLSTRPASDATGDRVAFESDCDLTGDNGDGSIEIFRVTSAGLVTQLTDDPGTSACEYAGPAISEDGNAVVFMGFCNPDGKNGDGSFEVFRARSSRVDQVTMATGCSSLSPVTRTSGTITAYVSDCDPAGTNADNSDEIFVSREPCACGAPVSRFESGQNPTASDALFTLQAAVGVASCATCECDVNTDAKVTATDALQILKAAVGQGVTLTCP
jgi:Tol biopolymer transport system component